LCVFVFVSTLLLAFATGRWVGWKDGLAVAEQRRQTLDQAMVVLESARKAFAQCDAVLRALREPATPKRPRRTPVAATKGKSCENCGGY
jgi:hypothetical protein